MESRHLHFNISTGLWMVGFLLFAIPAVKTGVKMLPGWADPAKGLVGYAFGSS